MPFSSRLRLRLTPLVCAFCLFLPGLLGMMVLPVGYAPDVWTHTYRVGSILNGDIIARPVSSVSSYHSDPTQNVGGSVDDAMVQLSIDNYNGHDPGVVIADSIAVDDGQASDVPFNNTAVYNPVAYIPQLIGFSVGRLIGLSAVATYYLTEFTMLLFWTVIGTVSVMMLPRYRPVMLGVLLFPGMWMPYAFSISADCLSLALCVLFASMTVRAALETDDARCSRDLFACCAIGFFMSVTKFSNAPLFALVFAVPFVRKSRSGICWIVLWFCLAVFADVLWLKIGTSGFTSSPAVVSYEVVEARKSDLPGSLIAFMNGLVYSVLHAEGWYRFGREGVALFWIGLALGIAFVLSRIIVASHSSDGAVWKPMGWFWLWCCIVVLAAAIISYFALWLQFTAPGLPGVSGVQYRYFLPYLPIAALLVADCCQQSRLKRVHGR